MASAQHFKVTEIKSGKNKGRYRVEICTAGNTLFVSAKVYQRLAQAERAIEAAKKADRVRYV